MLNIGFEKEREKRKRNGLYSDKDIKLSHAYPMNEN
jgi:hypothetical protein